MVSKINDTNPTMDLWCVVYSVHYKVAMFVDILYKEWKLLFAFVHTYTQQILVVMVDVVVKLWLNSQFTPRTFEVTSPLVMMHKNE